MKALSIAFIALLLLPGCASQQIGLDDPFSEQLAFYFGNQRRAKYVFLTTAAVFALAFSGATYFTTARSLGDVSDLNTVGLYSTSVVSAVSLGTGAYYFYQWSKNNDLYLRTLELQTQYYNIVQP
jgi:hypothetical protein